MTTSQDSASRSDRDEKELLICHTGIFIHAAYFVSPLRLIALLNPTKMNDRESMEGRQNAAPMHFGHVSRGMHSSRIHAI